MKRIRFYFNFTTPQTLIMNLFTPHITYTLPINLQQFIIRMHTRLIRAAIRRNSVDYDTIDTVGDGKTERWIGRVFEEVDLFSEKKIKKLRFS